MNSKRTRPRSARKPGCTIRDPDAAALQLRRAGGVLMHDGVEDGAVHRVAFAIVPRAMLATALAQIDAVDRPPGDLYFVELRAQCAALGCNEA